MKVQISPYKIEKRKENQVTSPTPFKKNQRKVSDDYKYDENGLFSERIFGRIGKCECGELREPGLCKTCNTRVVDPKNMPDFFIDLGVKLPKLHTDYGSYRDVREILEYKAFLYLDENGDPESIIKFDINDELSNYDPSRVRIGCEAAKIIHPDIDPWIDRYLIDYISVPYPVYRPNLRKDNGEIKISPTNQALMDILSQLEMLQDYTFIFNEDYSENNRDDSIVFHLLAFYGEIYVHFEAFMKEIFNIFCGGKKSFIGDNIRSHRITGAIKATVINRYDLDEDIVLIGDTFIQTLYPSLYKDTDGDMKAINDYFIDNDERVLINRPPTIGHLSIMGMKPRVASCYKIGTFNDGALGKHEQAEYDDEIDTLGIRTIAINPIITDGMAGDFDGDCLLLIALYGKNAKKEGDAMLPSKNFMRYSNGEIRNVIPEDVAFIDR